MERTWFVVADQSQAQLYKVAGSEREPQLEHIEILDHQEARTQSQSAPGDSNPRMSFVDRSGAVTEEQRRFARKLVARLEAAHRGGEFKRVVVAAPPSLVGTLRTLYPAVIGDALTEVVGDYVHESRHELARRMKKRGWLQSSSASAG